jgi:mutator protein MutT
MADITCNLIFLLKDDQILLAMKKRGFGAGRWNGVGGKIDPGETIEQAAVRECQEEIGVTPEDLEQVAFHRFTFPDDTPDMLAHVFLCRSWKGEPTETEEMAPCWFAVKDIPYGEMWDDDIIWLPAVLAGKKLSTVFGFGTRDNVTSAQIKLVSNFQKNHKAKATPE